MKCALIVLRCLKKQTVKSFVALACSILTIPAFASTTGTWISDSTGQPISAPTVNYSADWPFQGTVSASFTGLDFGVNIGHLEFDTGLLTSASSVPVSWSNPFIWDNPVVGYAWYGNVASHLQDGTIASYNTATGVTYDALNTFNDLINGGPSESTVGISVPIPDFPFLSLSIGTTVKFDVHIDTGHLVNVDQSAIIQSFTVLPGASSDIQTGNNLTVKGTFTNTGAITIESGAVLTCNLPTANAGLIRLDGGLLHTSSITNAGRIEWNSGQVDGTLINSGIIANTATGNGPFVNATITNQLNATIDIQGNGGFAGSGGAVLNNAGLLRKSGGSGTSVIDGGIQFNNTGTVEVDSGTLAITASYKNTDASTNGNFVFANGGRFQLGGDHVFYASGTNSGAGSGVLEIPLGGILYGSGAATVNFAAGSEILLDGGHLGSGTNNDSLLNAGRIEWNSGQVDGTLINSGIIANTATGNGPFVNATITNQLNATIDIQGNGGFAGSGGAVLNNAGLLRKSGGSGTSVIDGGIQFNNTGTVEVDSGTLEFDQAYNQTSGSLYLHGGTVVTNGTLTLQGGNLRGTGTVNNGLYLLSSSSLVLTIGGIVQGTEYDHLDVHGSVTLGGDLILSFASGFEVLVASGETFTLLTADNPITGTFADVANGGRLETADGLGSFIVNYGPGSPYGPNAVVLSNGVSDAPEPGTDGMLCMGTIVLLSRRRTRT